jgi:polyphosphate glucokinase
MGEPTMRSKEMRRGEEPGPNGSIPGPADPSDLAIGIDFGGSGIKGAIVDLRVGEFAGDRIRIKTPQPSLPRDVVAVMKDLVAGLLAAPLGASSAPLPSGDGAALPIGVGIPAATRDGTVLTAANIDPAWVGYPAEREMGLALGRTVAIGNDADVAGLAEMRFGAGRDQRGTVFVLTIGTGMGSALFVDGRLVPNTELGHLEFKGRDAEERVAESARDRLGLNWREWAAGFDDYLHLLEKLFWPDCFILGGGGSKRADNYLQFLTVKTPVVVATLRNNAGIVGSALMAHEKQARDKEAARKPALP